MRRIHEPDPNTARRLTGRLRQISAHEWRALATQLDPLRGDEIARVWRRAEHRAQWMAPIFREPGTITRVAFALGELVGEFKSLRSRRRDHIRHRAVTDEIAAGPRRDHSNAMHELHDLVAASCPGDRVLLEMVLLGAQLVAYRAAIPQTVVRDRYAFLELVLPFADLTAA